MSIKAVTDDELNEEENIPTPEEQDTPTHRCEFIDLASRRSYLDNLRIRRMTIAVRAERIRNLTLTKKGTIEKRLARIDKVLILCDTKITLAEKLLDEVLG